MSVLSDSQILSELGHNVVIEPFIKEHLSSNSHDVTLGEWYYHPAPSWATGGDRGRPQFFCIDNPEHIAQYWGLSPENEDVDDKGCKTYGAKRAHLVTTKDEAIMYGVEVGDKIIVIEPGVTILSNTEEFIGGRGNITTQMHARSSTGRSCISVCMCAGLGDVGFCNRYCMEIKNHGLETVVLKTGLMIAQISFHYCGPVLNPYTNKGQYQTTDDIEVLKATWSPTMMIPSSAIKLMSEF
jgi:dCTP deaminase